METKEYTFVDRTGWPSGEWDGEPDMVQWQDATGLPCIARRNYRLGNWCGYVGVPEGHPFFKEDHERPSVDVHGGLTYADLYSPAEDEHGICHVPSAGEPGHVWWFGFDCAHPWDYLPCAVQLGNERGCPFGVGEDQKYRSLEYVKSQCSSLATQLTAVQSDGTAQETPTVASNS